MADALPPHGDSPVPPPLPPAGASEPPLAVVAPTLSYALPGRRRPGIVTAVGVTSIVLSLFGGCCGLSTVQSAWGMLMVSRAFVPVPVPGPPATTAPAGRTVPAPTTVAAATAGTDPSTLAAGPRPDPYPVVVQATPVVETENGIPNPQRATVVGVLGELRPLTPGQRAALDRFLAAEGQAVSPVLADPGLTASTVRVVFVNTRPLAPAATDGPPPAFVDFDTATGQLRVTDASATFFPKGGGDPVVVPPPLPAVGADAPFVPRPLTPAEVDAALAGLSKLTPVGTPQFTPAQVAALRNLLSDPNQHLVIGPAADGIQAVTIDPNSGMAAVTTSGGFVSLDKAGVVVSQFTATGFAGAGPMFNVNRAAAVLTAVAGGASALLAVLLLIAGIVTLGGSTRGRRLHVIYAWAKIPTVLTAAAAGAWMVYGLMNTVPFGLAAGAPGAAMSFGIGMGMWFVLPAVLGLIYPVTLLIVMRSRTVRAYYAGGA